MTTILYFKDTWFDLSDFETSGSFSVTDGKIVSPANSTGYIRFGNATGLQAYTIELQAEWTADGGGANLLQISLATINTFSAQGATISIGGASNTGKIVTYRQLSNLTTTSSGSLSPSVGDIITLRIERLVTGFFNITASVGSNSITLNVYLMPNAHKITIPATGNTFEIQSFKWYTPYPQFLPRMVMGDSITVGANSTSLLTKAYASLIGAVRTSGLGDRTTEGLARIKDVTWRLLPKKLFVMMGTNDGAIGTTAQNNLTAIYNACVASGTTCVFLSPIPRNGVNMSGYITWLAANYPNNYIDTYTPLLGTGTNMNAAYDAGDGIHPNDAGHALIATTILNHSLYT